jgi:hypothetical protein
MSHFYHCRALNPSHGELRLDGVACPCRTGTRQGALGMLQHKVTTCAALVAFTLSIVPGPLFAQAVLEPVRAAPTALIDESIGQLFNTYPEGGPELAARIASTVVEDPNTAHAVVAYMRTSQITEGQKLAAEQGLAEALKRLRATNFVGGGVGVAVVIAALIGVGIWAVSSDDDGGNKNKNKNKKMAKKVSPN